MNPLFLKSGRSFPLLYPSKDMKGDPLLNITENRWFKLPFVIQSFDVPLSHELHARTDHIVDTVSPGTKCADVSSSLMLDRAYLWKYVKFVPRMSFDEFMLTVGCGNTQRSQACTDASARLSAGSGHDRRLASASTVVNQKVDAIPIIVAVVAIVSVIAIVSILIRRR